jgi:acetyl-CoA carboxylase biotin carboxyl carrier protein
MKLTDADIAQIVALLKDSDYDDIELEWDDIHLRITRRSQLQTQEAVPQSPPTSPPIPAAVSPQPSHASPQRPPDGIVEVRSTLMGTAYRAAKPGDPPFVDVGSIVAASDTLCLIEVMKVFTAIKAQQAGVVERILVNDGELVEYNQVIFWIRHSEARPG